MTLLRKPVLAGIFGAAGLMAFYMGLVGLSSRSWSHVLELLADDWPFMVAITAGFGIQVGLLVYLRGVLKKKSLSGNIMATAGTGTSTASMVACCMHHLVDVLPVVGLSGAALFLSQYRYQLMAAGIAVNIAGIAIMVRTIRRHTSSTCCQAEKR